MADTDTETNDKTINDSAGDPVTEVVVTPSAIDTSPETIFVVTHKVSDFAKWKMSYDAHDSLRLTGGIHNYVIGRSVEDSNTVLVAVKADDMSKAKAFATDPSLKAAMQRGGVIGKPSILLVTTSFQDTAVINTPIRALNTFNIKDWDNWQKVFTEGKQERMDNGIVDRVYGHEADNNKKVMLVTAITDTAKAFAYWKSDKLQKRREASGVIGKPERFVFRVVKRY